MNQEDRFAGFYFSLISKTKTFKQKQFKSYITGIHFFGCKKYYNTHFVKTKLYRMAKKKTPKYKIFREYEENNFFAKD